VASIIERIDFDCSIYLMLAIISLTVPKPVQHAHPTGAERHSVIDKEMIDATSSAMVNDEKANRSFQNSLARQNSG
jgi:hypothetical protein